MTDRQMNRICVFCGTNPGSRPEYGEAARQLGRILAEQGIELVYGGASVGIMGELADSVHERLGRYVFANREAIAEFRKRPDHGTCCAFRPAFVAYRGLKPLPLSSGVTAVINAETPVPVLLKFLKGDALLAKRHAKMNSRNYMCRFVYRRRFLAINRRKPGFQNVDFFGASLCLAHNLLDDSPTGQVAKPA